MSDSDQHPNVPDRVVAQILRSLDAIQDDLGDIKRQLGEGGVKLEAVQSLPDRVTRLEETTATLRLLVYSAVGIMLVGLLGTVGAAVVWVISKGGGG